MDTACERPGAGPVFVGDIIQFQSDRLDFHAALPRSAAHFFVIASDAFTSYEAVVEATRHLFEDWTNIPAEACRTMAASTFLYEDASVRSQEEPKTPDTPWLRAEVICDVACAVAVGPYASLPPRDVAEILLAALQAASSVCGDPELAFIYLDNRIAHLASYYSAQLEHSRRYGLPVSEQRTAAANVNRVAEVLAAANLTKQTNA